jgi:peroxiredoxin
MGRNRVTKRRNRPQQHTSEATPPSLPSTSQRQQRMLAVAASARTRRRRILGFAAVSTVALVAILFAVFRSATGGSNSSATGSGGSSYPYQVGQPGRGAVAPEFQLTSTLGGTFDLATQHGKTVLLFLQEGLSCQPCWDQLKAVEGDMAQLHSLGIDEVVSITTDPIDLLGQKVSDEGITSPVLSDPDLKVSSMYQANQYGMMGTTRDGHTFIVIGPDGRIRWRADYGGAPNYTMNVPMDVLLQQMQAGLTKT